MRKLLNVLYVTTPDSYLSRDGENVVIKANNAEVFRIPVHNLEGIICFGYMGASPALMALCAERNVGLSFLTEYGRFYAKITGRVTGNVLLRRQQYRMADNEECSLNVASNCIRGKIINSRAVLKRAIRDHEPVINVTKIQNSINKLNGNLKQIDKCLNIDELRGIEGNAAREYFSVMNELILSQKDSFYMEERSRRPPKDNFNAVLSFLYTILVHDIQSALETVGLDPYVGFLHKDRPGRASLALDMMEELRPYLVDRMTLSLINRRQITGKGFIQKESGGIIMEDDTKKKVITSWQKRKQDMIVHPFLKEKIEIGLIPYVQAMLMARYIRGDLDGYPPFFWN